MRAAQLLLSLAVLAFVGNGSLDEFWKDPADLEQRDLFRGPDGGISPPDGGTTYSFVKKDTGGFSEGYEVRDPNGTVWDVKLGPEAQPEVVASRLLWAIGFHQTPMYYLGEWTLAGQDAGRKPAARFRPRLPGERVVGSWKWEEHPNAQTPQGGGLIAALMMMNDFDLKTDNNKVIEISSDGSTRRMYIVRDLGATFGSNRQHPVAQLFATRAAIGKRNDVEAFEKSGFIAGVENGYVKFSYTGPDEWVVKHISPAHVQWAAQLFSRLSDKQWQDACRAGGYTADEGARFIAVMKKRIAQALAL